MGDFGKQFSTILGVILIVIIVAILATVLAGSEILGNATLGSFTGFVSIALLIPLILIGIIIWKAWRNSGE